MDSFIDYCMGFYGPYGIYDMGTTREDVGRAARAYLASGVEFAGDSVDRERVRDILIAAFGYTFPGETAA